MSMKKRRIRKDRAVLLAAAAAVIVLAAAGSVRLLYSALKTDSGKADSSEQTAETDSKNPEDETGQTQTETKNEKEVLITATGDMLLEDGFISWFQDGSWNDYMSDLSPWLSADDWTIANLEVPIAGEELGLAGADYCFNAPAETAQNIRDNSFDYVSLANNHAMDRGAEGAELTLQHLDVQGIGHTGLFLSEEQRNTVSISEVNGIRIAVLSWTYGTNQPVDTWWRVNVFSDPYNEQVSVLLSDIQKAKEQADAVIVCMHWGTEFTYDLNESQMLIGQQIADAGADVIIGNHPHTIQPAAWLEGEDGHRTLCFYSLGNLISSAYTVSRADETFQNMYEVGAMAQFSLSQAADGTIQVKDPQIIPIINHFEGEYENFRLMPLKDYTEELAAAHSQAAWSSEFSAEWLKDQVRQVYAGSGIPLVLD